MTSLNLRYARPNELLHGRVNLAKTGELFELRIDPAAGIDSAVFQPLIALARTTLPQVLSMIEPGRSPIVRYYVERNLPGGRLVAADIAPYQADIYVEHGLMPQDVADEIAGHSTHLIRRLTPPR
jgi:hypothetical protein